MLLVRDAVVQTAFPALPIFKVRWHEPISAPKRRKRHVHGMLRHHDGNFPKQFISTGEFAALFGSPCTDFAGVGASNEVCLGFFGSDFMHFALDADLSFQLIPEKEDGCLGICV